MNTDIPTVHHRSPGADAAGSDDIAPISRRFAPASRPAAGRAPAADRPAAAPRTPVPVAGSVPAPVLAHATAPRPCEEHLEHPWDRWWHRFRVAAGDGAGAAPDVTAMRGMVLGLLAGLVPGDGPGGARRSMTRRVADVVLVMDVLAEHGRADLVADLAGLALRRLDADDRLTGNPDAWEWDAAVDLALCHTHACAALGVVPVRLPDALRLRTGPGGFPAVA